ncbi:MAG: glycoside hydrolase family 43 protein, partial [Actinomycetota bacterium]|nr:glycoside hydrolase family 43 protein [Actinomycetota bacterium]
MIRRATCAVCASVFLAAPAVPASGSAAGIGGVTRISDRQEQRSCDYATRHGSATERRSHARACDRVDRSSTRSAAAVTSMAYQNPVYDFSFPDPGVFRNGAGDYYAYSTGGGFPVLHSTDLVHWESVGQALPDRPSWAVRTGDWHPWAPSVLRSPGACPGTQSPGCYLLYYVGLSGLHSPATHCVAVAWSPTPAGPFTDLGPIQATDGTLDASGRPPGCGDDAGYSNIDPAPFLDPDGEAYLYLSTNRRCDAPTTAPCPLAPTISVLSLSRDLTRVAGTRTALFAGIPGSWEQEPGQSPKVENPWVERRGSTYYLFYSGGDYRRAYGMGYATAPSPTGPFTKAPINPILRQTADVLSPGGGSVTKGTEGGDWMVYHGRAGSYAAPRTLRIDPLVWRADGSVMVKGPTTGPQPAARPAPEAAAPASAARAPGPGPPRPALDQIEAALGLDLLV